MNLDIDPPFYVIPSASQVEFERGLILQPTSIGTLNNCIRFCEPIEEFIQDFTIADTHRLMFEIINRSSNGQRSLPPMLRSAVSFIVPRVCLTPGRVDKPFVDRNQLLQNCIPSVSLLYQLVPILA